MSGIEVAGLALGAFPIATYAFDQYRLLNETRRRWREIVRTFYKSLNRLEHQQLRLRLHLQELLLPLVNEGTIDDADLEPLLTEPSGRKWKEPNLETALAQRLSESHDIYIQLLRDLVEAVAAVWKLLGADKPEFRAAVDERASANARSPFAQLLGRANREFQAQRLHIALKHQSIEQYLDDIEGYNESLQQLLYQVDRVTILSQRRATNKLSTADVPDTLLHFWQYANQIHTLMTRALSCPCQDSHIAHVCLEQRTQPEVSLRLMVMPWPWTLLRVHPDEMSQSRQQWSSVPLKTSAQHGTQLRPSTASVISYHGQHATTRGAIPSATTTQVVSPSTSPVLPGLRSNELTDVCKAMGTCGPFVGCLGTLVDHNNDGRYSLDSESVTSDSLRGQTLTQLLEPSNRSAPSRMDRYELALTLASSYLQLYPTPWLGHPLTGEVILIPEEVNGDCVYTKPYMAASFAHTAASPEASPKKLAIVLLELCFGKRLQDHEAWIKAAQLPDPADREREVLDLVTLWSRKVLRESGLKYQQAVDWCLQQQAGAAIDEQWRREFAANVMAPLQRICIAMKE